MQTKNDGSRGLFQFDGLTAGRKDIAGEVRTREASTLATYAKHARSLFKQAGQLSEILTGEQLGNVVRWFVERDCEWEKILFHPIGLRSFVQWSKPSRRG